MIKNIQTVLENNSNELTPPLTAKALCGQETARQLQASLYGQHHLIAFFLSFNMFQHLRQISSPVSRSILCVAKAIKCLSKVILPVIGVSSGGVPSRSAYHKEHQNKFEKLPRPDSNQSLFTSHDFN